jgi:hypothetical protein
MREPFRIGNAQAFWGDDPDAAARTLAQQPDLDFLTLDYLAEVSLSIMAAQRERNPEAGYARDFVDVVRSLAPFWKNGSKTHVVTNAGGLNPEGCGRACLELLRALDLPALKIAVVTGDDVLEKITEGKASSFPSDETQYVARDRNPPVQFTTANAYLGARGIVEGLQAGAQIVITGRVADPSLMVAPCIAHFEWGFEEYDKLAAATVAGHLLECGTQACGGFSTDWLDLPDPTNIGFPFVEMHEDGTFVITKPPGTGGRVDLRTIKEQLLYEIGDPANYLSPDVTVSLLGISLREVGENRVEVKGAIGSAPPPSYKVSATYRDGFKAHAMITIFGRDATKKARLCGEGILGRLEKSGHTFERSLVECLGAGASIQIHDKSDLLETVLRVSVADKNRASVERFTKEIASLVTWGPQGVTGYSGGRAKVQDVFGYHPCLIDKQLVQEKMILLS